MKPYYVEAVHLPNVPDYQSLCGWSVQSQIGEYSSPSFCKWEKPDADKLAKRLNDAFAAGRDWQSRNSLANLANED